MSEEASVIQKERERERKRAEYILWEDWCVSKQEAETEEVYVSSNSRGMLSSGSPAALTLLF